MHHMPHIPLFYFCVGFSCRLVFVCFCVLTLYWIFKPCHATPAHQKPSESFHDYMKHLNQCARQTHYVYYTWQFLPRHAHLLHRYFLLMKKMCLSGKRQTNYVFINHCCCVYKWLQNPNPFNVTMDLSYHRRKWRFVSNGEKDDTENIPDGETK